jgi:hypothetical protein
MWKEFPYEGWSTMKRQSPEFFISMKHDEALTAVINGLIDTSRSVESIDRMVIEDRVGISDKVTIKVLRPKSFPRFWELFSFVLPHKTRERVFEPHYQELLEDYLVTRGRYRTPVAKKWLTFCFAFRTGLMVLDCLRVLLTHKALQFLLGIIPEAVKQWWWSLMM